MTGKTPKVVTASMLYDLVHCPHRVMMDAFSDPYDRDEINAFVQLLWEKGTLYEKEVISKLESGSFLDLSEFSGIEKEQKTREAIEDSVSLIYSGRISTGNLLGDPDLLKRVGKRYIAGDIKSGVGEEGEGYSARLKKHYAMQLALYTDILQREGISGGRYGFIWDINGNEVVYDFESKINQRSEQTWWDEYLTNLEIAESILYKSCETLPAYSSVCKLCHWHNTCLTTLQEKNDLTLIPELGRAKRDAIVDEILDIEEFASTNIDSLMVGKKTKFPGIGPASLVKFHDRAKLVAQSDPKPYLRSPVQLPQERKELFFDIEVDPMRDICYLHGFVERVDNNSDSEQFIYFFADGEEDELEEETFKNAWEYIKSSQPCAVYFYSKYERTIYRKLLKKYPGVCGEDELEDFFSSNKTVDLYYDVVKKCTEWPTHDHSIKTLAKYLGFNWRDSHPSGAASIQWFDEWVKTRDPKTKQRILDYNEDDCVATRVLLDGIREL